MKRWKREQLLAALERGQIVPLVEANWSALAGAFEVVAAIDTGLAGSLLLVRRPRPVGSRRGWAIVEQPQPDERVVRPLVDEASARALIADRLAAYERMWDG